MLVLSRGVKQKIIIGDQKIEVEILSVHGNQVRLGITAPKDIPVHRKEVFEKNQEASLTEAQQGRKSIRP